jgi:hypothetical protein
MDGATLAIQLDSKSGERVHPSFGVSPSLKGDTVNVNFIISSEMAQKLEAIQKTLLAHVFKHRMEIFGASCTKTEEELGKMLSPLVAPEKANPAGEPYPRTMMVPVDPMKLKRTKDDQEHDVSLLVGDNYLSCEPDDSAHETLMQLVGLPWTTIIFQVSMIYIAGGNKIGIFRRMRYMACTDVQDGEIRPLAPDDE